jgi:hypothetical protein
VRTWREGCVYDLRLGRGSDDVPGSTDETSCAYHLLDGSQTGEAASRFSAWRAPFRPAVAWLGRVNFHPKVVLPFSTKKHAKLDPAGILITPAEKIQIHTHGSTAWWLAAFGWMDS